MVSAYEATIAPSLQSAEEMWSGAWCLPLVDASGSVPTLAISQASSPSPGHVVHQGPRLPASGILAPFHSPSYACADGSGSQILIHNLVVLLQAGRHPQCKVSNILLLLLLLLHLLLLLLLLSYGFRNCC